MHVYIEKSTQRIDQFETFLTNYFQKIKFSNVKVEYNVKTTNYESDFFDSLENSHIIYSCNNNSLFQHKIPVINYDCSVKSLYDKLSIIKEYYIDPLPLK